jgi:RNA-directed DNA polymerase
VKRRTIGKRMRGKLRQTKQQLRERMHDPVLQTGEWLKSVVQGYFNYYAVPGNTDSLRVFSGACDLPLAAGTTTPQPKGPAHCGPAVHSRGTLTPRTSRLHPYPEQRFAASHPR